LFFTKKERFFKKLSLYLLGILLPAVLWIVYYTACFGSPFHLALAYENPAFTVVRNKAFSLWGLFSLPRPMILFQLLFGYSRGLLWTQGWILLLILILVAIYFKNWPTTSWDPASMRLVYFASASLLVLLITNASFDNWHGGNIAGPRYIASILPTFAILLGLIYDKNSTWGKGLLWGFVISSTVLFILAFSLKPLVSNRPLWPFYLSLFTDPRLFNVAKTKLALLLLIFSWSTLKMFQRGTRKT
jgi:hypothetical protein